MAQKRTPTATRAAEEIRGHMARQSKKTGELANLLGIKHEAAARRMRGETPFDVDQLDKTATWLKVPISHLIKPPEPKLLEPAES